VLSCQSTPERASSWLWPPPIGVSLLRGSLAADASQQADPRVIYLVPVGTVAPLPSLGRAAVVHWRAGAFEPHSVAVRVGGTVRIVNGGAQAHRLFTAGDHPIQIELQGHAEHRLSASEQGPSHVYCSLHPSEYFFVYSTHQRHHGVVAEDGSWSLGPVAPGDYHLMLWTPSGEVALRDVRIWPWTVQSHRNLRLGPAARQR
jgi:hypothetical protein